MANNYDIGYGKPPKSTRFKTGQSGNTKGRPKGRKREDMLDLLTKELKSKLILKDGNKITKETALIRQLCNKASTGDYKSGKLILDIAIKRQGSSLAVEFLNKLIKENYISEENAKDYINSNKILNAKSPPAAVYNLYRGVNNIKTKAEMSLTGILFLASIWERFLASIVTTSMLETVTNEYYFWEGVEETLKHLHIDKAQRAELLKKLEENRAVPRPSDELYSTALDLHTFMTFGTVSSFMTIREAYQTTPGYEEVEKELLSEEYHKYLLSKAKEESKPSEYESIKSTLEGFRKEYPEFMNFPFNTKHLDSLQKKLKKDAIHKLFEWYENALHAELHTK